MTQQVVAKRQSVLQGMTEEQLGTVRDQLGKLLVHSSRLRNIVDNLVISAQLHTTARYALQAFCENQKLVWESGIEEAVLRFAQEVSAQPFRRADILAAVPTVIGEFLTKEVAAEQRAEKTQQLAQQQVQTQQQQQAKFLVTVPGTDSVAHITCGGLLVIICNSAPAVIADCSALLQGQAQQQGHGVLVWSSGSDSYPLAATKSVPYGAWVASANSSTGLKEVVTRDVQTFQASSSADGQEIDPEKQGATAAQVPAAVAQVPATVVLVVESGRSLYMPQFDASKCSVGTIEEGCRRLRNAVRDCNSFAVVLVSPCSEDEQQELQSRLSAHYTVLTYKREGVLSGKTSGGFDAQSVPDDSAPQVGEQEKLPAD